ncbi:MAG: nuclear transport factor 2 family protein [Bacteroidales bacterium]|nr:nuclear transport factor 2 family protein [Bacteroidales bacterium]MBN2820478.1 nuclear transport factor 2 family protein [Bacteroidales bacterium]
MKYLTKILIICITSLLLVSCQPKPDLKTEEQKIIQLFDELAINANQANWEAYSKLWNNSPKLQVIHPNSGDWLSGWQEFAKVYEPIIKKGVNADYVKKDFRINFSNTGELAWGTVDLTMRFEQNDSLIHRTWNVFVAEKIDNEWKLDLVSQSVPKTK